MGVKFWKWLHQYAEKRIYQLEGGCQCKCPQCGTWTSFMKDASRYAWRVTFDPMIDEMTCGKCGHQSYWRCDGPIPFLVPEITKMTTGNNKRRSVENNDER